jgi:hypothetical protein
VSVDDRVVGVAGVEIDLPAHGRTTETVTVAADAGDDTVKEMAVASRIEGPKVEGIEDRDRPRPHREHIAKNPADPGRRPLVRLDC